MLANNKICVHVVTCTGELVLYFTIYYGIFHNRGRVYGNDRRYKGGDLTSRAII